MKRFVPIIGLLLLLAMIMLLGSWTGPDQPAAGLMAVAVLLTALPLTLAWLAAAAGFGWLFVARLPVHQRCDAILLQIVLGIAALLVIDAGLGSLGALQLGGSIGGWSVIIIGIGLLVWQILMRGSGKAGTGNRQQSRTDSSAPNANSQFSIAFLWLLAVPPVAVLLVASTSAPGWLWESEFGGYDVLSYHLQLPKEWLDAGRIQLLEHNVYSALPNFCEAAYYHLMVLAGSPFDALYSAQLLHAAMAVLTAMLTARVVMAILPIHYVNRHAIGVGAGVLLLATPWVIVTGSLAYNEMFVCLFLAGALLLLGSTPLRVMRNRTKDRCAGTDRTPPIANSPSPIAISMGLLIGAAAGAKLTAVVFVGLPLMLVLALLVLAVRSDHRRAGAAVLCIAVVVAGVVLSPWLVRNAVTTGNPVFPYAADLFGTGHWSQQQIDIWHAGHSGPVSFSDRVVESWRQLFRYGIGPNPYGPGSEPWFPQWLILPWLVLLAAIAAIASRGIKKKGAGASPDDDWKQNRAERTTPIANSQFPIAFSLLLVLIIIVQVAFWFGFTHIKSRFMLPFVVPACVLTALGFAVVMNRAGEHATRTILRRIVAGIGLCIVAAWSAAPVVIFRVQRGGAPAARIGWVDLMTGEALPPTERRQLAAISPTYLINFGLPPDSRVLLVGDAAPLYYTQPVVYTTTWDRGPMSVAIDQHPDDPPAWFEQIRQQGFTHLLIEPAMLERWIQAGWSDPALDPRQLISAAEAHADLLGSFPTGVRVYHLSSR